MESAKAAGTGDAEVQVSVFARIETHRICILYIAAKISFQVNELKELHAKELASGAESREALSNEMDAKLSA